MGDELNASTTADPISFARHASLQVLLVPVTPIKRSTFAAHCQQIRAYSRIPLRDVPSDARGDRAALSASPRSRGHVLFTFVDSHARTKAYLEDFEPSRRLFGIIGIVDCTEWDDLQDAHAEFQQVLRRYPRTFATRCYAFSPRDNHRDDVDGIVTIPSVGEPGFYISTLLADLASTILYELSNMLASLETRQSVSTPRESLLYQPFEYLQPRSSTPTLSAGYSFPSSKSTPDLASIKTSELPRSGSPALTQSPTSAGGTNGLVPPGGSSAPEGGTSALRSSTSDVYTLAATDKTTRRRMQGRMAKLKGDLHSLAGRWLEAVTLYNEAITTAKAVVDPLWEAAALERLLLTMALLAWLPNVADSPQMAITTPRVDLTTLAARPSSQDNAAQALSNVRELPDRSATVVALYTKLVPPATAPASLDALPPVLYIETCLRHARLQMALMKHGGWSAATLASLMEEHAWPLRLPSTISSSVGIARSHVADTLSTAYHSSLSTLPLADRLFYLSTLAAAFGSLSYHRKRAVIALEAAAVTSEAIAKARREAQSLQGTRGGAVVSTTPEVEGNEVVVALLEQTIDAYGVEIVKKRQEGETKRVSIIGGGGAGSGGAIKKEKGEDEAEEAFGWPDLQVATVRDAITMTEMLPDYASTLRFTVSALRQVATYMPPLDQYQLSQSIPPILQHATRRGATFALDYWGPLELLISIEPVILGPDHLPVETGQSDVTTTNAMAGPFIYAPGQAKRSAATTIDLVQNHAAEFLVTLQNPFLFDLELQSIELSTSGCTFASSPSPVTLPPSSFHIVRLCGTPTATGALTVRGCKVRLANAGLQEFILPLFSADEELRRRRRESLLLENDQLKQTGLSIWRGRSHRSVDSWGDMRFLECRVVRELPLLRLKSTSLIHGAIMLYDGERSSIQLVLENVSTLPVGSIDLAFTDTWTTATQLELRGDDLPAGEAYELALALRERPVFGWAKPADGTVVEPGASVVLIVQCLGKVGCTEGEIIIKYSCTTGSDEANPLGRQLVVPVAMTVHRALEATTMSISRQHATSSSVQPSGDTAGLHEVDRERHCLLAVDVRNIYGQPFEVALDCDGESSTRTAQRVEPGTMSTLLLRLDRIRLSADAAAAPIPTPAGKQFVVDKSARTAAEERAARQLFWYREAFLDRITATWQEIGTLRHGQISLRGLRLTQPMLEVLKPPLLSVSLDLAHDAKTSDPLRPIAVDSPFTIRVSMRHDAGSPLDLIVHFDVLPARQRQPLVPRHSMQNLPEPPAVLFEGSPRTAIRRAPPGELIGAEVTALSLACGRFEVGCTVQDVATGELYLATEPLVLQVGG